MSKLRQIHQPGRFSYTYTPNLEPIAKVDPGETIVIHTVDAFENKLNSPADLCTKKCAFPFLNPQTGPIYVNGAKKGDTLVVKIHDIAPARDFAVTALIPNFGGLTGTKYTALLNDPLPEETRIMPIVNGMVQFSENILLPYRPFMGTIGVAPEIEAVSSLVPSYYGGNMDCVETCPGNEVWFPVLVDGAMFFTGDAHATQGDGEVTGVAAEIPAAVTVSFEVHRHRAISWPRLRSPTHIMAAGSARPLEDAARIAWCELIAWMVEDYGFDRWEAYHLLGQVGEMRLGNMVDPNYTMVAKLDRQYLL